MSLKAAIAGVLGYSGRELVKILENHSNAEIVIATSESRDGYISDFFPSISKSANIKLQKFNPEIICKEADVVFLALPTEVSYKKVPELLKINPKMKIIDLSGAYRITSVEDFNEYYGFRHDYPDIVSQFTYGLSEIYYNEIKDSSLISNPGCYPSSILIPLIPLAKAGVISSESIIIDSRSGISGKGKKVDESSLYCELNENSYSYKIGKHQHTPEIIRFVQANGTDCNILFSPSIIPCNRGIISSIYFTSDKTLAEIKDILINKYKSSIFIKVLKDNIYPKISDVVFTNQVHMNIFNDSRTGYFIISSVIDNLIKGASGQAVQNMNLMCNFKENEGLL